MNSHYSEGMRDLFAYYKKVGALKKDAAKVRAGRLGGLAGRGKAKARKVTSEQARRAALARWAQQNAQSK